MRIHYLLETQYVPAYHSVFVKGSHQQVERNQQLAAKLSKSLHMSRDFRSSQ